MSHTEELFLDTYEDSRRRFRQQLVRLQSRWPLAALGRFAVAGDDTTTIDWIEAPSTGRWTQCIIITTGLHGAEGLAGAAAMLLFGLGTIPALVVFAVGAGQSSPAIQRRFNRLAAVLVILIGVQLLCRGAAALGWIGHLRIGEVVLW